MKATETRNAAGRLGGGTRHAFTMEAAMTTTTTPGLATLLVRPQYLQPLAHEPVLHLGPEA